ncbi:MAG TPA: hypothetical protein PLN21_20710 [Gemmatales bacterium]|nr:hypothetical protein [Gemmatales bacterium]
MMSWDFPYRLGGPVLAWELHRGRQRWTVQILSISFLSFCLVHFFFTASVYLDRQASQLQQPRLNLKPAVLLEIQNEARLTFAAHYLSRFFPLQLLILLLATPALSAGALGQEKEKDTLTALFCTELTDYEIVRGKVMGRYWQLVRFMLFSMPFPFVLAGFARLNIIPILLLYLHAFIITFALVGICIFSAVITRRTRDAIMACYSIIIIITLISLTLLGDRPLPTWLNPAEVVIGLSSPPFTNILPWTLFQHLFVFWFIGWFFVKLSCWTIRWACLRQLEDRSMRWRWGIRSGIGDDPIRWRERHILGIAPLPALRMIPTWLGALGCMAFSLSMILGIINNLTHGRLAYDVFSRDWNGVYHIFGTLQSHSVQGEVILMGVILILFASITILTRCAGSITEEKRMKTWDDLLMTGMRVDKIAASKMWGIVQASMLFIASYALPLLAFSFLGGPGCVVAAVICLMITPAVVYFAAEIGMGISLSGSEKELNRRR